MVSLSGVHPIAIHDRECPALFEKIPAENFSRDFFMDYLIGRLLGTPCQKEYWSSGSILSVCIPHDVGWAASQKVPGIRDHEKPELQEEDQVTDFLK